MWTHMALLGACLRRPDHLLSGPNSSCRSDRRFGSIDHDLALLAFSFNLNLNFNFTLTFTSTSTSARLPVVGSAARCKRSLSHSAAHFAIGQISFLSSACFRAGQTTSCTCGGQTVAANDELAASNDSISPS